MREEFAERHTFGARVRELRTNRNWSQEQFAHVAELDRTYVYEIERGRRNPTLDVIHRIAHALDVDVADLFLITDEHRSRTP